MGKIQHLKFNLARLEYMRAVDLIRHLRNEGICQIVEDDHFVVIGRYGTNKANLRKKLV